MFIFSTERFLGKFAVKLLLKIPSHFLYASTLPRETLTSKQAIYDNLQSVIATYLSCGGVVNDPIKKGLLLSLSVNFF